jgi:hypothetical protein
MSNIIFICLLIILFTHALHGRFKETNPKRAFRIAVAGMMAVLLLLLANSEPYVLALEKFALGLGR